MHKSLLFLAGVAVSTLSAPAFASVNVIKVCNYRAEVVWASYATEVFGSFKSNGWYQMEPSQCIDLLSNFSGLFQLFAYSSSGWKSTNAFGIDSVVSPSRVCVRLPVWHENLDQRVCGNAPAGSEYRFEQGHIFDFTTANFNVYEIGLN
ncbi:MAG TPA: DUF1036 domain-containing protein [Oligoflexus sp.]|uniref:DUF1036 domain-containing protein n=1 Tax=Oligoflexus sp. TaxID=1971216 RepID=UPI002D633E9E|nr:DUF1036 domain-containing protein [Oligoflexus sp.]HYX33525.1 DUF1036 domain-containing protein [Oligoflexus sp.]